MQKAAGSATLNQSRTSSKANEVAGISETTGTAWIDPAHDKAGNMTTIPKPASPATGYSCKYDAWNRLTEVKEGAAVVAKYEYDGRNFRVVKKTYSGGSLAETRHFYYNTGWQCLEERIESGGSISGYAQQQYVWGARYIDAMVLRDRDTSGPANGTLDERFYSLQDPNFNVVALADTAGDVQERYSYNAYGKCQVLTPAFADRASSSYDWQYRFTGRRLDSESGLYYYRNRYYHPQLGRFINCDPIGYGGRDVNLYRYALGNPLRLGDAHGLLAESTQQQGDKQLITACDKYYNETVRRNTTFRKCWQAVVSRARSLPKEQGKKCLALTIRCGCCRRLGIKNMMAFYLPKAHGIGICAEDPDVRRSNTEVVVSTLCHEIIHVLQSAPCHPQPLPRSCTNDIMKEIEAYYCTGSCPTARTCVNKGVASAKANPGGPCKKGKPTRDQFVELIKWAHTLIKNGTMCQTGITPGLF